MYKHYFFFLTTYTPSHLKLSKHDNKNSDNMKAIRTKSYIFKGATFQTVSKTF